MKFITYFNIGVLLTLEGVLYRHFILLPKIK